MRISLIGSALDPYGVNAASYTLNGRTYTINLSAQDGFDQLLQNQPLSDGTQQATFTLSDRAGNFAITPLTFQVQAQDFILGPSGSKGWGAHNSATVILGEQDSLVTQTSLEIPLGGSQGSRTLSFDLKAGFDNSDKTSFT